ARSAGTAARGPRTSSGSGAPSAAPASRPTVTARRGTPGSRCPGSAPCPRRPAHGRSPPPAPGSPPPASAGTARPPSPPPPPAPPPHRKEQPVRDLPPAPLPPAGAHPLQDGRERRVVGPAAAPGVAVEARPRLLPQPAGRDQLVEDARGLRPVGERRVHHPP